MELDALRERIQSVKGFELGITSVCDESVHLFEFGGDDVESVHEFVMTASLQPALLFLRIVKEFLNFLQSRILLLEVLMPRHVLLDDVDIRV